MEEQHTCETCRHFYRHYVHRCRNIYDPLDLGHCGEPRIRDKRVDTPACHRWRKEK